MTVRHIMCYDMKNHMIRHRRMIQDAIDCRLKDVSPNGNVVLDIIVNYKRSQANRANTFLEE